MGQIQRMGSSMYFSIGILNFAKFNPIINLTCPTGTLRLSSSSSCWDSSQDSAPHKEFQVNLFFHHRIREFKENYGFSTQLVLVMIREV